MSDPWKPALDRTPECPGLEALAETPRPPEIEQHVEHCSHCRTELALLREFETAEPGPEELASVQWIESELRKRQTPAVAARPSVWERLSGWFAPGRQQVWVMAAATLMVLVAAGLYFRPDGTARPAAAPDRTVWRSGKFAAIGPVGEVSTSPREFRWEPVADATNYRLQLMEVDRTVIWTGESSAPDVAIPDAVRAQFLPGRSFEWQAIARNAAGEQLAATDLQTFHIPVTRP
jgi:hypothetical protein